MEKALEQERARILAESEGRQPAPSSGSSGPRAVMSMSDKLAKLQRAAEHALHRNTVYLPDLSNAYTLMDNREANPVRIEAVITDIAPDALLASGTLPVNIRRLLSELIERSESITKEQREKVNMYDVARDIARDAYAGDIAATAGDAIQLQWTVACMAVSGFLFDGEPNDPPIRLMMERGTPDGLWIGTLSDRDREIIVKAAWERVETEASAVEPFRRTADADETMATVGTHEHTTERATDV